ncbi:MAG: hypothetical protein LBQ54_04570 [Planctomycetaceae bacterium]|jgi:hypothetical protein|nr:hypothetical protein [Planctomycetaceae bacterium]
MALPHFWVDDRKIDSLDLKVLLIGQGIHVHEEVYDTLADTHRITRNLRSCNTLFLGDNLPVYIGRTGPETPFHLVIHEGKPVLNYAGNFLTEVRIPLGTRFFAQKTSHGIPFGEISTIQGEDMLAFSYLWPCELAKSHHECRFCHSGNATYQMVAENIWRDFFLPPEDIADIIHYAVETEPQIKMVQLTAGSTFTPDEEVDRYAAILREMTRRVDTSRMSHVLLYLTPPKNFKKLDSLFEAGATEIAFDLDIWDKSLFKEYCPGKAEFTTHRQHIDALLYIAETLGPNKACSVLVAGLEPVESLLEGATFLAEHGIVPLPSPLMPFGVNNPALPATPGMEYFRRLRSEMAGLYLKHDLVVPGTAGSSVCLSRDIWLRRHLLAEQVPV